MAQIRGLTWAHTRGVGPLAVTSQVFSDFHPETEVLWEKQSLYSFGEGVNDELFENYDLLVIDHPFIGLAARHGGLLPLEGLLPPQFLQELRANSAGPSFDTYSYGGHQWALPIDASCQVSAVRADLLHQAGIPRPRTWAEAVDLARETGKVALPLAPMGALGSFLTLCANLGAPPMREPTCFVQREAGLEALQSLASLFRHIDRRCLEMYPNQLLARMASTDTILYVPFSYGYCSYSREGMAPHPITFHNIPAAGSSGCVGATLGGVGLAVSARCRHRDEALDYLSWVAGAECQRTVYVLAGGQPSHAAAWDDDLANRICGDFFRNTRASLEAAYVRPTFPGYTKFQSRAGRLVQDFLQGAVCAGDLLDTLDQAHADSLRALSQ